MTGKKLVVWLLLFFGIILGCPDHVAAQEEFSGTCGPSATWSLNKESKVLTIRGTGVVTKRIPLREVDSEGYIVGNSDVEQIVIEDGITAIAANRPFLYLQNTRSISLPETLQEISDTSFYYLEKLKSIVIPETVNKVGEAVFLRTCSLEEITVASGNPNYCSVDGVLYSKDQRCLLAFPASKKLPKGIFSVPEKVQEIAPLAFGWSKVKQIVLPEWMKELGGGAFFECSQLKEINLRDTNISKLMDYNGKKISLARDSLLEDYEYTEDCNDIKDELFIFGTFAGTALQSLVLPDRIQEISHWCLERSLIRKLYLGTDYIGDVNGFSQEDTLMYCYDSGTIYLHPFIELEQIEVAGDNSRYMVKDDILYSKDGTVVYGIPQNSQKWDLVLDQRVRQIAPFAFYKNEFVHRICCKESLVSIGEYSFYQSKIQDFLVDGNVSFIEKYAFALSELMEFSVTGHVFSIQEYAFNTCEYLEDADLQVGRQLFEMVRNAFDHLITMQRLKKILVPDLSAFPKRQYQDLMEAAVSKWQRIQENYQDGKRQCGEHAYWKLDGNKMVVYGSGEISKPIVCSEDVAEEIRELVIEEGITGITGQKVFADIHSIRRIKLPDSLETISAFAFYGITQLTKITIPKNVKQIGEGAFYGIFCLRKVLVDPENPIFASRDGIVFSKDFRQLLHFPGGFRSDSEVFIVPETVIEIGPLAFAWCTSGIKIVLPKSLQKIRDGAFYACQAKEINLQDTKVTELPDYNGWKWKVNDHDYPEEKKYQEEEKNYYWGMFEKASFYNLVLPDGVKKVSSHCFRNSRLCHLTLGADYCGSINKLKDPWDCKQEEDLLDDFQTSLLLSDYLHAGLVVEISDQNQNYRTEDGVIYNKDCTVAYGLSDRKRSKVVLKDTVTEIAPTAFWGERFLRTVIIPGDLQKIGAGAFVGSGLSEIKSNGIISQIGEYAFSRSRLSSFESQGVCWVGNYAFEHTYLSAVVLGEDVEFLGKGVFRNCYALQELAMDGKISFLMSDAFSHCPSLQWVYAPVMGWNKRPLYG